VLASVFLSFCVSSNSPEPVYLPLGLLTWDAESKNGLGRHFENVPKEEYSAYRKVSEPQNN
jgi:hypothetical protein